MIVTDQDVAEIQHDSTKALARIIAEALALLGSDSEDAADLLPLLRDRLSPLSSDPCRICGAGEGDRMHNLVSSNVDAHPYAWPTPDATPKEADDDQTQQEQQRTDLNYLIDTTDARAWATEWCKIAHEIEAADDDREVIDEGWMLSWFANAIETGRRYPHTDTP